VIYFIEEIGTGRIVVGTERSLPRFLEGPGDRAEAMVDPLTGKRCGHRRQRRLNRQAGAFASRFHPPRQVEGDEETARGIHERFAHLRLGSHHLYSPGPDLLSYMAEIAGPWTGENARALGQPIPKAREGAPVPIRHGLARRPR